MKHLIFSHKWISLIFTFFILMFAISGIFLNHRQAISQWDLPRQWLPEKYHYQNWNNGSIKGTLMLDEKRLLLYGRIGLWLTDTHGTYFTPFMEGIEPGADNRNIRMVVKDNEGQLFAISKFVLYRYQKSRQEWQELPITGCNDYLSDIQIRDDTLYVMSRSHIYLAKKTYQEFQKLTLQAASEQKKTVSLFKTFWDLHSGALFGLPGIIVVDIIAGVTILLSMSGMLLTCFRKYIRLNRKKEKDIHLPASLWVNRFSTRWHNRLGNLFFPLLLLIIVTGTFLRPPLLIAIIRSHIPPIPGSIHANDNPWHDQLRALRYDKDQQRWLFASARSLYELSSLTAQPQRLSGTPPVSMMGINVWERLAVDRWIIGSFSGIYLWERGENRVIDLLTGRPAASGHERRRPVLSNPVSGFSANFSQGPLLFFYDLGALPLHSSTPFPKMPEEIGKGRLPLWNFFLELHTGRLYRNFLGPLTPFFIFFSGLIFLCIIVSGYIIYRKRKNNTPKRRTT